VDTAAPSLHTSPLTRFCELGLNLSYIPSSNVLSDQMLIPIFNLNYWENSFNHPAQLS
jgi:hypothetical protein